MAVGVREGTLKGISAPTNVLVMSLERFWHNCTLRSGSLEKAVTLALVGLPLGIVWSRSRVFWVLGAPYRGGLTTERISSLLPPPYPLKPGPKDTSRPENPRKMTKIDGVRSKKFKWSEELGPGLGSALVVLSKGNRVLSKALDRTTRVWGPDFTRALVVLSRIPCVRCPELNQ
jgi:hypothetical protein